MNEIADYPRYKHTNSNELTAPSLAPAFSLHTPLPTVFTSDPYTFTK